MSSTEPAWIPPMRGSTRRSTTRWPSLRATSGPMDRSPMGPRTSGRGSSASRASPSWPRESEDAANGRRARTGSGCPAPGLRAAGAPAAGPHAGAAPGDRDQGVAQPDLAAQLDRLGPASEEPVRPRIDDAPAERRAAQARRRAGRKPRRRRLRALAHGRSAPPVSSHAAASPLMPPPTTTTRRRSAIVRHRATCAPRSRRRPGQR